MFPIHETSHLSQGAALLLRDFVDELAHRRRVSADDVEQGARVLLRHRHGAGEIMRVMRVSHGLQFPLETERDYMDRAGLQGARRHL